MGYHVINGRLEYVKNRGKERNLAPKTLPFSDIDRELESQQSRRMKRNPLASRVSKRDIAERIMDHFINTGKKTPEHIAWSFQKLSRNGWVRDVSRNKPVESDKVRNIRGINAETYAGHIHDGPSYVAEKDTNHG